MTKDLAKKSLFQKFLDGIEIVGNKLPHPVTLFLLLAFITAILSHIYFLLGASVTYMTAAGEITARATSLLTREGISYIFTSAVSNFTNFAPLGTVLVAMLGVGAAEQVGLISTVLRKVVLSTPKTFITAIIVFAALMSSIATDAGYVVIIPLGAAVFYALGRHPIAGLAAAFFGVSGGFSANIIITPLDAILSNISTEAARILDPTVSVPITANWYFLMVSTIVITIVGTIITEKVVAPRLGVYNKADGAVIDTGVSMEITDVEKRGLRFAGLFLLGSVILILALLLPPNAPLRNAETGAMFTGSPFMASIVFIIMVIFLFMAIGYGIGTGVIKNDKSVVDAMTKSMSSMGSYLVLAFFSAQFINYFNYSRLGIIVSVNGANFLESIGFRGVPLILSFILLTMFLNLFIGSASAKWVIMAPIFVPMFMHLGYDPAFTQVLYRIGDSLTNIITPTMAYFALIVVFAEKYDKKAGIGTIIATMLPYTIIVGIVWTLLIIIWYLIGLPLGLGGNIYI